MMRLHLRRRCGLGSRPSRLKGRWEGGREGGREAGKVEKPGKDQEKSHGPEEAFSHTILFLKEGREGGREKGNTQIKSVIRTFHRLLHKEQMLRLIPPMKIRKKRWDIPPSLLPSLPPSLPHGSRSKS